MSDVTVAPSPQPSEVAIETNPVSTPNPISQQAPDKPEAQLRRESIQKAFERANNPPPKGERPKPKEAKPAEAKPGHNSPPEETPKETLDLKKRPAERGEHGHFARQSQVGNDGHAQMPKDAQTGTPNAQPAQPRQLPANAPFREPPARSSERARADWHATPESVRGDIHRIQSEFVKAYNFYKDDHQAFKPIRHFHEMALKHGTTLEKALTNFVGIEQKLREDPIAGLDTIVHNLGLKSADGQPIGLRDIAYHVLTQTPDQLRAIQQGNVQTAATQQIGALHEEVKGLKNSLQQMHNQQVFAHTRNGIDHFATTHPRTDELADLIEREVKLGFDLETAYRRADLLRPSTHAAQTRTTSAQTRPSSDRSITGAPAGPTNGSGRRPERQVGRREAIANAFKHARGGL